MGAAHEHVDQNAQQHGPDVHVGGSAQPDQPVERLTQVVSPIHSGSLIAAARLPRNGYAHFVYTNLTFQRA